MTFSYFIILGPSQVNALPEAPSPPSDTKSAQNNIWHLFLPLHSRQGLLEVAKISSTFTLIPVLSAEGMNIQIWGFRAHLGLGFSALVSVHLEALKHVYLRVFVSSPAEKARIGQRSSFH